jgi:hypothetical protein
VFHVSHAAPIIDVSLPDLRANWAQILTVLGCKSAWRDGLRPGYLPDFGLALSKAGLAQGADGKKYFQVFMSLPIMMTARLSDDLYTFSAVLGSAAFGDEDQPCMASFDFGAHLYPSFLAQLGPEFGEQVKSALSRQPYRANFHRLTAPELTFAAEPGDSTHSNENESYRPLVVSEFI